MNVKLKFFVPTVYLNYAGVAFSFLICQLFSTVYAAEETLISVHGFFGHFSINSCSFFQKCFYSAKELQCIYIVFILVCEMKILQVLNDLSSINLFDSMYPNKKSSSLVVSFDKKIIL